jgi:hypothetical protein
MADPALVARLVEALMHAQLQLLTYNGCQTTDDPDVLARLPAELKPLFWQVENGPVLAAVQAALDEAAAASFSGPETLEPPENIR